ncbi:MAG TPA: hypothetical protein V6C65_08060, partial [Allocoleopsis sp.]
MTEIAPEGQGSVEGAQGITEGQPESTGTPNINPAWNEVIGVIPPQLHSQIIPHFQKWDQNFQTKINEVHSQYEPWKQFIDNGVEPSDVDYALGLLNALSENPQEVIKALNEWAGTGNPTEQQGQFNQTQQPGQENDDPILSHPKVQEMQKGLETLAQIILSQREQEQQSAADQELENDLKALKDAHGEFDEEIVLALAMQGDKFDYAALENAVKKVVAMNPPARQPGPP